MGHSQESGLKAVALCWNLKLNHVGAIPIEHRETYSQIYNMFEIWPIILLK